MTKSVAILRINTNRESVTDRWDGLTDFPDSITDDAGNIYIRLGDRNDLAAWVSWQNKDPRRVTLTFGSHYITRDVSRIDEQPPLDRVSGL